MLGRQEGVMAKVEILEVSTECGGNRKTEYIVSPDGLVKQTQLRVIGRAFARSYFIFRKS